MDLAKEQWIWISSILSVIIGSLMTILANYYKEKSNRKTQVMLENIKKYDDKKFQAYLDLYKFISKAFSYYWPPDDPRRDFSALMKKYFFIKVKKNYPYLKKDIREKIRLLEIQYNCLCEPDFIEKIPMDKFFNSEYLKILNELNENVEKIFDEWNSIKT